MTALARLDGLDSRAWSTATWSAPFITQLVLALLIVMPWLLGKYFVGAAGLVLFLVSAAAVLPVCALTTGLLIRSAASRVQGLALSIAGSYAVVLFGGFIFGLWTLQW